MFVMPLSRPVSRALVTPQFSRFIDRLLDDSFERPSPAASVATPALDVSETDTAYTVELDVPGVTREQLKVSIEGRRVSIETTDATNDASPQTVNAGQPAVASPRTLYRERSAARYARTVSLPAAVDQAASQARFENGVLTLTLPKKVASGATQLNIG
jgi:HSP20 family protein